MNNIVRLDRFRGTAGAPNGAANGAQNGAPNGAPNGAVRQPLRRAAPFAPFSPVKPGENGGSTLRMPARTPTPQARNCAPNGAVNGAYSGAANVDAEYVIYRLEEAGTALLSLPSTGYTTALRTTRLDIVRSALEGFATDSATQNRGRLRPAMPDAARITRMDEALGWIVLLPKDRVVLRRIVGARCLVSPVTERHLYTWRRLGALVGADHKAVQRWHAQAIDLIVTALNQG